MIPVVAFFAIDALVLPRHDDAAILRFDLGRRQEVAQVGGVVEPAFLIFNRIARLRRQALDD